MNYLLLIRLLVAHFAADFIFQPNDWVKDKVEKKGKSKYLLFHGGIIFVLTFLAVMDFSLFWVVFIIASTHIIIDRIKSGFENDTLAIFFIDQLLHIAIIFICWIIYTSNFTEFQSGIINLYNNSVLWIYILGYLLITMPASIVITKITSKFAGDLESSSESLKDAGKWIGIIERILILTFIVLNQFEAIGFLIAAKSVFRFSELKDGKDQKKTEYILIGTLLSFSIAIIIGISVVYFTKIILS